MLLPSLDTRPQEILVRKAGAADAGAIASLHVEAWQLAYRGIVPDSLLDSLSVETFERSWRERLEIDAAILVAEYAGRVVGFSVFGASRDSDAVPGWTGEVHGLYVAPSHWARGAGRVLWAHSLERLRADGFSEVVVWTFEANERSRRFYAGRGCTVDDIGPVEREYHGVFVPVVRFRTSLATSPLP